MVSIVADDGELGFLRGGQRRRVAAATKAGAGLRNMHDRLAAVGGELTIGPGANGLGTRIGGALPLTSLPEPSG
jgi:signal transduction histidine kinase